MGVGNGGLLDGVRRIAGKFRDLDLAGGLPGAPLGLRLRGAVPSGPPAQGTWRAGDVVADRAGAIHTCTSGGAPGAWSRTAVLLEPSGDVTGKEDVARINEVIANGGDCVLAWTGTGWASGATPFYVSSPLLPSTGSSLRGQVPWQAVNADNYGSSTGTTGGTVIYVLPSFSGPAVINMTNATSSQYYGVTLSNFCLEMYQMPSAGHGILVDGAWGACIMDGVCCNGAYTDNLHFQTDATSGFCGDDWLVTRCKFSAAYQGYGVYADNLPDSWFTDCESSESQLDNWWLGFSLNTSLTRCKGENSKAGAGFHLTGQGGAGRALGLNGCTTHLNFEDGFLFDGTSSGSAGGTYLLSNCYAISDNQAAGTAYAGYRCSGSVGTVMAGNCYAYGAYYGASQVSSSTGGMTFVNSDLSGTGAATHDDASNTTALQSQLPAGGVMPQVTTPHGLTGYVQQSQAAATSAVTVASTASIASLGSVTVPKGDPAAGAVYRFSLSGVFSIASAGTATTYVLDVRWGGTGGTLLNSLHSTSTANSTLLPNSTALSAVPVLIEGEVDFRTSTTVVGWLRMTWNNSTTAATPPAVSLAVISSPVTVTTSSAESLTVDWTWGTNSASNTITIESSVFERAA